MQLSESVHLYPAQSQGVCPDAIHGLRAAGISGVHSANDTEHINDKIIVIIAVFIFVTPFIFRSTLILIHAGIAIQILHLQRTHRGIYRNKSGCLDLCCLA